MRPLGAGVEGTLAYAASEYVAAESLDVALKHYAPATLDKVLPFITQLAGAIDFARTVGIGHGALHPRDVFVTPDEARATGFGIVQALEAVGVRAPVRRPYTAPERVDGGAWDVRADVYSLGAIAFELLTARRPVGADVRDLGNTAGPYADLLGASISRALADDPADRYPNALAFAAALEASSRGEGVIAPVAAPVGASVDDEGSPASMSADRFSADERTLVVDPDIEVEREADEGEFQLRDEEPFVRQAEDLATELPSDRTASLEMPPELDFPEPPALPQEPTLAPEPMFATPPSAEPQEEFQWADAPAEEPPEALLFDVDRAGEPEREPEPAAAEPQLAARMPEPEVAQRRSVYAPLSYERAAVSRRPRSVFVPAALTLLLGLFVGFLGGYLVGSRESNGGSTTASTSAPDAASATPPAGGSALSKPSARVTSTVPPIKPGAGASGPADSARASSERAVAGPPSSRPAARSTPAPARGRLMVRSTPAGAQVFVNGRRRGSTPLALRDLTPGSYTLRMTRAGYEEQTRRITVGGSAVREVSVRLQPVRPAAPASFTGSLYVDSRPRGARVFLDGTSIGTTPMQAGDIRAGAHVVRLELKDHRTWTSSARIVAGEVTRVTGSLERQR